MASPKTKSKKSKKAAGKTASGAMTASKRNKIPATDYAFPKERKEPLNDAKHVRNAVARFDQVKGRQRHGEGRGVEANPEGRKEVRRRGEGDVLAQAWPLDKGKSGAKTRRRARRPQERRKKSAKG